MGQNWEASSTACITVEAQPFDLFLVGYRRATRDESTAASTSAGGVFTDRSMRSAMFIRVPLSVGRRNDLDAALDGVSGAMRGEYGRGER